MVKAKRWETFIAVHRMCDSRRRSTSIQRMYQTHTICMSIYCSVYHPVGLKSFVIFVMSRDGDQRKNWSEKKSTQIYYSSRLQSTHRNFGTLLKSVNPTIVPNFIIGAYSRIIGLQMCEAVKRTACRVPKVQKFSLFK